MGRYTLYEPKEAETMAVELQMDDPEWVYNAVHDPAGLGWSFVEVYDEDGEFLGRI